MYRESVKDSVAGGLNRRIEEATKYNRRLLRDVGQALLGRIGGDIGKDKRGAFRIGPILNPLALHRTVPSTRSDGICSTCRAGQLHRQPEDSGAR